MAPMSSPVEALASDRLRIFQVHTEGLGDNSYVLTSAGEAIVVDPQRDLDRFFELLSKLDARLVGVLETHLHNDYVSGGPALATAKGAPYRVPAGAGFEVNHTELGDGDELQVGSVRLRALSTPGHTRHHMSYAVLEGDSVVAVFTGGSMLVGACGRTDLVGSEWTTSLAEDQYRSSRRLSSLPEQALILPTHGAGSFCAATEGGSARWSTVGEERQQNPAIKASNVRSFVSGQLGRLLAYPAYYARMAGENRAGRAAWEARRPPSVSAERACDLIGKGVRVLDGRPRRSFAAAHIPGSVNIELDAGFATYVGWLFPAGTRYLLVLDEGQDPLEAARQCGRIGIEEIEGTLEGGIDSWRRAGYPLSSYEVSDAGGLRRVLDSGAVTILDVRQDKEWEGGHIPGAMHVHVADLPRRLAEIPSDLPVYAYCRSGQRAAIAASLLDGAGYRTVLVDGGFRDWQQRGYPVE